MDIDVDVDIDIYIDIYMGVLMVESRKCSCLVSQAAPEHEGMDIPDSPIGREAQPEPRRGLNARISQEVCPDGMPERAGLCKTGLQGILPREATAVGPAQLGGIPCADGDGVDRLLCGLAPLSDCGHGGDVPHPSLDSPRSATPRVHVSAMRCVLPVHP
jgi:hypothetical protein